ITSGTLGTGDTANFTESYSSPNVGTGLTLTPSGNVSDGNGGHNYTVTFANSNNGTITAAATSSVVTSTANPSTIGAPVTFTVTVTNTSSGVTPVGGVGFYDGGTYLGAGTPGSSGGNQAHWTFTTSMLSAGTHAITAVFTGNSNFQNSTSPVLTQA